MSDESKISVFTFLGAALTCFCLGWLIRDKVDSVVPLILFLVGILGVFAKIYFTVDGQKWANIVSMVKEELGKKDKE